MSRFSQFSLGVRLMIILALFFFNYLLFGSVGVMLALPFVGADRIQSIVAGNFAQHADKYIMLLVQGVGSLGAFAFTALLVGQLETGAAFKRLRLNIKAPIKIFALTVFAILIAQIFIQFVVDLNQHIPVPGFLKQIVEEGQRQVKMEEALLNDKSALYFIFVTLVFAVIAPLGEELFFRGLLLGELLKEKFHPVTAITITGFVFSVAHAQFENFLAIWILGIFLGYLFYTTGSLWVPIAAHFTNNFLVVLLKYLYNIGVITADIENVTVPMLAVAISIVIFGTCIFLFNKWKTEPDFEDISLNEPTEI